MSCFTFEFGEPDSYIYHLSPSSVSHVTILSRGITGNIHLKTGEVISKVPRLTCEALVAWLNEQSALSIPSPVWIGVDPGKALVKPIPPAIAKPIGWEGTFSEAVEAMQEGWKIKRGCWADIRHLMKVDDKIITHQGLEWLAINKDILATDWELVAD